MSKRSRGLPYPQPSYTQSTPSARGGSYLAITKAADRYLARAEEAVRMASLLWVDVDSGLEAEIEDLAAEILRVRRASVAQVADLYGDRLREGVF